MSHDNVREWPQVFFSLQQVMHMVSLVFILKNYFRVICLFRNNVLIQDDWIGNGAAEDLRHSNTWKPKIMIGPRCLPAQYCVLWSCSPAGLCWVSSWVWPGGTPGHSGKQSQSGVKQSLRAVPAQPPCSTRQGPDHLWSHNTWTPVSVAEINSSLGKSTLFFIHIRWRLIKI